jgi:hypothetical protein
MSTTDEHDPTDQETAIYQALNDGDHDTIDELRQAAIEAGPEELEQFQADYQNAYDHYQSDHETPQDQREQQTQEQVQSENESAEA